MPHHKRGLWKRLRPRRAAELLAQPEWHVDESLTQRMRAARRANLSHEQVYVNENGEVISVIYDRSANWYATIEAFMTFLTLVEGTRVDTNSINTMVIGTDDAAFGEHISQYTDALAVKLKVPREVLDYSMTSVETLDRVGHRLGRRKLMTPPLFPMLVAYLGEVARRMTNTEWQLRPHAQSPAHWNIWLVGKEGAAAQVDFPLWKHLHPDEGPWWLPGAVISIERRYNRALHDALRPPPSPPPYPFAIEARPATFIPGAAKHPQPDPSSTDEQPNAEDDDSET